MAPIQVAGHLDKSLLQHSLIPPATAPHTQPTEPEGTVFTALQAPSSRSSILPFLQTSTCAGTWQPPAPETLIIHSDSVTVGHWAHIWFRAFSFPPACYSHSSSSPGEQSSGKSTQLCPFSSGRKLSLRSRRDPTPLQGQLCCDSPELGVCATLTHWVSSPQSVPPAHGNNRQLFNKHISQFVLARSSVFYTTFSTQLTTADQWPTLHSLPSTCCQIMLGTAFLGQKHQSQVRSTCFSRPASATPCARTAQLKPGLWHGTSHLATQAGEQQRLFPISRAVVALSRYPTTSIITA